jgi:hypothetical protein
MNDNQEHAQEKDGGDNLDEHEPLRSSITL